jgi:two-component system response regulator BaeR
MSQANILIVEDEKKLADLLVDYFHRDNFNCDCVYHGDEVLDAVRARAPDAILLDIMLPGKDGLTLCREIRSFSNVPILMITARIDEIDRLLGLELGADDYICKPFSAREVVARVKAILRRSRGDINKIVAQTVKLDEARYQVTYLDSTFDLTSVEFQLLKKLISEPGRIFSRNQLMAYMYEDHRIVSDRTIDSHIKKIRKKFNQLFPDSEFIYSVYGVGYKLDLMPVSPPKQ